MVHDYYTLHDRATDSYRTPFIAPTESAAIRMIRDGIRELKQLMLHADDLTLVCIGGFDDASGTLLPMPLRVITPLSTLAATVKEAPDDAQNG